MTPKDKADYLISKYRNIDIEIGGQYDGYAYMKINDAKECALIAVDEVLSTMDEEDNYVMYKYWQQVKQEIDKL